MMKRLSSEELKKWHTERGLDDLKDEEIVVNGIRRINDYSVEISALANVYMKNGETYSAHIKFLAKRHE